MFLPLSDAPNPRGVPYVTYAIVAVNVAIYLFITVPLSDLPADPKDPAVAEYVRVIGDQLGHRVPMRQVLAELSEYDLFVFKHGFRPAAPNAFDLLFSIFLHAGFLHLFGNMLFLWIYGDNVEHRLGRVRFLFWYLITGVAATLFHALFFRRSQLPLVGASGAISGVLGFYFVWFPRNEVRVLLFIFPFLMRVVPLSARLVLGLYLVLDNLLPFLFAGDSGGAGVAFGAHIGGFLTGFLAATWMDRRDLVAPASDYEPEAAVGSPSGAIRDALAGGRLRDAAGLYLSLDPRQTRNLLSATELLEIAAWLAANGHARAAQAVYLRQLRDYPTGSAAAEAHLGVGLVQLQQLGEVTPAYQHFLDALDLDPSPQVEAQARAALRLIAARQKFQVERSI